MIESGLNKIDTFLKFLEKISATCQRNIQRGKNQATGFLLV